MKIGYLMQQGVNIRQRPFNGPANHVREVVQELENLGHRVRVIVRLEGQTWVTDDLETFVPIRVRWLDQGPLRWFERLVRRIQSELKLPYAAFFESLRFAQACQQTLAGYDLLYERLSWMGYGGALASRWLKIPLILEDNGDQLADLESKGIAPQGLQRRLSIGVTGWAVRQATQIVSTGEGWRRQFIKRWGVPDTKVTTVENGTTTIDLLKRENLRAFRGLKASEVTPTLVYLGGFYPWHGVPVLLRAFSQALKFGKSMRLILIGSGIGEDEARALTSDLHLKDHVEFAGQLSPAEFTAVLADADIGLSPYCGWPEYSGLKIFDYKAAGLACIASGEEGMPATISQGKTGWIVPPCDEEALRVAILELAQDLERTWQMGRVARLEAEQHHQWQHTAQTLEKIFLSINVI